MDWKYINSLPVTDIDDSTKDALCNMIAWYDCESEKLDFEKTMVLLKFSQQVMRYKSEQVEALLAELDELAKRQGEEEAKKQDSDYDLKSVRSKRSGSVDIEDLENKYRDLKMKFKKLQKAMDKTNTENEKLKKNVKLLQQEREHLQNELERGHQDESSSDISEAVKDQHKDLADKLNLKNNHISQLLTDIENVEGENLILRKKLTMVRDELSDATDKLESVTNQMQVSSVKMEECKESAENLKIENESLKTQIGDMIEDKNQRENEFEEFTVEIDKRIEEWKKILEEKNKEISDLKIKISQILTSSKSSSNSSVKEDYSQINTLNKAISERESQILDLQAKLETAVKEMEENTNVLEKLVQERDTYMRKFENTTVICKDFKKQLKNAHNRCQELQENIKYQENLVEMKETDIQELINKLDNGTEIDLKQTLQQVQELKTQKRFKEKQISDLVRTCNKLQASVDNLEKENIILRERLGLSEDDFVSTKSVNSQQRKYRKQMERLKQEKKYLEEEKIEFRLEIQKLSKIISNLSDQIIDFGETPNINHETIAKELKDQNIEKEAVKVDVNDYVKKEEYVAVIDENNALRKGLHEILDSVQSKKETSTKEIKSDTLESLLRALDVKHVSGWYHPAMRLQAELHALQGSNNELREQLRAAREELQKLKEKSSTFVMHTEITEIAADHQDSENAETIANLNKHLLNVLKNYKYEEENNALLTKKLEEYKTEFTTIQEQISILYNQYIDERYTWETTLKENLKQKEDAEEKAAIFESKLQTLDLFTDAKTADEIKAVKAAEMAGNLIILNRKCVYLESQESLYRKQIADLKNEMLNLETATITKINKLNEEKGILLNKIRIYEQENISFKSQAYTKLQNEYENLVIKYREVLHSVEEIRKVNLNELEVLNRQIDLLVKEKEELEEKLQQEINHRNNIIDFGRNEEYAKKLAQLEVNEMKERQRANHTNNLFELVKEQLQKSEEKYKEYQKYNNDILKKNLQLQESVKELENKLINLVDQDVYKSLEDSYLNLLKSQEELLSCKSQIENELVSLKKEMEAKKLWSYQEQYEFLNLRHQIVDLQSTGDDKTVIARLSSDVVMARMAEGETKRKLDEVTEELVKARKEHEDYGNILELEKARYENWRHALNKKIRNLETIVNLQRQYFIGFIPLVSHEKFISNIEELYKTKKAAYETLGKFQSTFEDSKTLKQGLQIKMEILDELSNMLKSDSDKANQVEQWYHDKNKIQLQELKYKRQSEFKEQQLKDFTERINKQEDNLAKLESELLESIILKEEKEPKSPKDLERISPVIVEIKPNKIEEISILSFDKDSQTENEIKSIDYTDNSVSDIMLSLKNELVLKQNELTAKIEVIDQLKSRILQLEMDISLFKQQLGDKQSQITFYEKHILEMQHKKEVFIEKNSNGNDEISRNEIISLQVSIKELQDNLLEKDNTILMYQSLLKKDRDEHSLAAARFQEELKDLQAKLHHYEKIASEKETVIVEHPSRVAIEKYILQVHALENHTSELHMSVTTLNSQLQASREEAVRWRNLANDRLKSVDELRLNLEEHHQNELKYYKDECNKWREEVSKLQEYIYKYKTDLSSLRPDIEKEFKQKENKIHELNVIIRQLRTNLRRQALNPPNPNANKEDDFEEIKENLLKEHEVLKKRFEQLMNREKSAREEIRTLKGQLLKRPLLSARSDSSTTKEQQLQKKLNSQDKEIQELKEKLQREITLNEVHKTKVNEDFEKWNKQKLFQQQSEKLKVKLKEKNDECDKLQQTCSGYRILIERLEREKHNLENRIKNLKSNNSNMNVMRQDMMEIEFGKLQSENIELREKLEMQQHHSGGLGAAMLQEKLEAQERKIAILEMSSKGGGELRAELERVQSTNANLQKSNLRLEAENLELRLDLEKSSKELPHLREQILHLENYIEVLKTENTEHKVSSSGDHVTQSSEPKRVTELERTVFVLKRIVEKLQVENKRLQGVGGSSRPCSDRANSAERVRREYSRLKEQYTDSVQKTARLEKELAKLKAKEGSQPEDAAGELEDVRGQLKQKAELLDKVKVLLHRAAAKEKALLEQVTALKAMIPQETIKEDDEEDDLP